MASSDNRAGLYVTIPLYFVLLAGCAIWANRRNRQEVSENEGGRSRVVHTDRLSSHYLGGRAIGPFLSAGTIFASFFSGYTVVGVPKEAFNNGFLAFRWVAMALSVLTGMAVSGLQRERRGNWRGISCIALLLTHFTRRLGSYNSITGYILTIKEGGFGEEPQDTR